MRHDQPITTFRFQFSGGLASRGELNFYELSRSQYAAARLLYTIARYQESGRVPQRISDNQLLISGLAPLSKVATFTTRFCSCNKIQRKLPLEFPSTHYSRWFGSICFQR